MYLKIRAGVKKLDFLRDMSPNRQWGKSTPLPLKKIKFRQNLKISIMHWKKHFFKFKTSFCIASAGSNEIFLKKCEKKYYCFIFVVPVCYHLFSVVSTTTIDDSVSYWNIIYKPFFKFAETSKYVTTFLVFLYWINKILAVHTGWDKSLNQ